MSVLTVLSVLLLFTVCSAVPTDFTVFGTRVTPTQFVDKVVYTCGQLPFRLVCPQTQSPSQSVTRWYVKDGKCCSYKYGYCQWEEIRTETSIRTKEACEAICLRGEAPTAPAGSYQTAGFAPGIPGIPGFPGSTIFPGGFTGGNSPAAVFPTNFPSSFQPSPGFNPTQIGFNPTLNPYVPPGFTSGNTQFNPNPTGFDASAKPNPTQPSSTFGTGVFGTNPTGFPSSTFGTGAFGTNPTGFPSSSFGSSSFPGSFGSSSFGPSTFGLPSSLNTQQPIYGQQNLFSTNTGVITNTPNQLRPTDTTGRFNPAGFNPVDNGYGIPPQKPVVPFS